MEDAYTDKNVKNANLDELPNDALWSSSFDGIGSFGNSALRTANSIKDSLPAIILTGGNGSKNKDSVALHDTEAPEGLPKPWDQPPPADLDGKCGITGVSNMLRFYDVDKDPKELDQYSRFRSWGTGMRKAKFAESVTELSGKQFSAHNVGNNENPLEVLRKNINDGKPVAICYNKHTDDAHWVLITGMKEGKDGVELTVQSWGGYKKVAWNDIKDAWSRGYPNSGAYPYVVGNESSPYLKKK